MKIFLKLGSSFVLEMAEATSTKVLALISKMEISRNNCVSERTMTPSIHVSAWKPPELPPLYSMGDKHA